MRKELEKLILACVAGSVLLTGCYTFRPNRGVYRVYEERYRLFFTKDQFHPRLLDRDPEIAAQSFAPMASLNRSFDDLTREGFELSSVKPIGAEGGATQFIFRRKIPDAYHPSSAPLEFFGLYKLEVGGPGPIYYIFDPLPSGYSVRMVRPAGEEIVTTVWDGRQLRWRQGEEDHSIVLSADGRSVIHTVSSPTAPGADRPIDTRTYEALRIAPAS